MIKNAGFRNIEVLKVGHLVARGIKAKVISSFAEEN